MHGSHRIDRSRYTWRLVCSRGRKRMKLSAPFAAVCLPALLLLPLMATAAHKHHAPAPAAASAPAAAPPAQAMGPGGIPSAPQVDARAYILTDYTSGQVLAQQNADA